MGFVEVEKKKRKTGRRGPAASFSVNKKGTGSLRINASGLEFMANNGVAIGAGDNIQIFHDAETGKLALKKNPEGKFRLTKNDPKGNSLRITSSELSDLISEATGYDLETGDGFGLILVPVTG